MKRILQRIFPLALVLAFSADAGAAEWTLKGGEVSYKLVHKLHEVIGTSTKLEAKAVLDANGLRVMARAPVASFDSHNGNRDQHMLEVVDGAQFPMVTLRAAAPGFVLPPGKTSLKLAGEVELHGVRTPVTVDVELDVADPAHVVARFTLVTSLTAHGIERPQLLFVPVEDALAVSGTLTFDERAPASG